MIVKNRFTDEVIGEFDISTKANLRGVDLSVANLSGAYLREVDLREAYLRGANLSGANLSKANLRGAYLSEADLSMANLSGVDLSVANLSEADLSEVDLREADLREAYLRGANLSGANLSGVDLSGVDLREAYLRGANLSGCKNLLNSKDWIKSNFQSNELGIIVYKGFFNTTYSIPSEWEIEENSFIEEVVNPDRCTNCGCGINFATQHWIEEEYPKSEIWECLIHWEDLVDVIVPFNTDGKARCARMQLIKKLN